MFKTPHILLFVFCFLFGVFSSKAQIYFSENFDQAFQTNTNAPTGWNQTALNLIGDGTVTPTGIDGPKNWEQNVRQQTSWLKGNAQGTSPISATGNGVLWLEDFAFGPQANTMSRRLESPSINLSTAVQPYLKFNYFCAQASNASYPLVIMASADNGTTWKSIAHVQPNAAIQTTSRSGSGLMSSSTPWSTILVKIPSVFMVSQAKFAFYRNASFNQTANLFIDSLLVTEYTPSTIQSVQSGLWSNPSTWLGGIVPDANSHVVIAANHTVEIDVNIARTQQLTIDGTLRFFSSSSEQVLQTFDQMTINANGAYTSNTSLTNLVARWTFIGAGLTNNGSVNVSGATSTALLFSGGNPSVINGTGTYINGHIPRIYQLNSGGLSFLSPLTVSNAFYLIEGPVLQAQLLTIGSVALGTTVTIVKNARSSFLNRPFLPKLTVNRNVLYGGTVNGNMPAAILGRDTIFNGLECDSLTANESIIYGGLTINTMDHVKLSSSLRVGSSTIGGSFSCQRGIVLTSNSNMLTLGPLSTGSIGIDPSTSNPPTSQGSYVLGPIKFERNNSNSNSIFIPLGLGASYLQNTVSANHLKTLVLNPGSNWNNQQLTFRLLTQTNGPLDTGLTSLMSDKTYQIDLNGGNDLPTSATLTLRGMNYTFGNSDNLSGNISQVYVAQATGPAGNTWRRRGLASNSAGTFVPNSIYTFTSTTSTPYGPIAPLATRGAFFSLVSNAPIMGISSTTIERNTAALAAGSQNNVMLRIRINTNGQLNRNLTQFNLSTNGTKNIAAIASARIYYTGLDSNFSLATPFGSNIANPSGNFICSGNQTLLPGSNYFWVVYSVSTQAQIGDSLAANVNSYVFNGTTQIPISPNLNYRVVTAGMSLLNIQTIQTNFNKVEQGSVNNQLLDIRLVMSSTGAPVTVSQFNFNTNGSGVNSAALIANAQLYYTGNSPIFSTQNLIGKFNNPQGLYTILSNTNLVNDTNYFWLTYDISTYATIADSVGSNLLSLAINGQTFNHNSTGTFNRKIFQAYCKSNAQSITDQEIWNVTLSNLNQTSNCNSTGGSGSILNAYSNYTFLPAANCTKGQSYQMSLILGSCAANQTSNAAVYIDFNQNSVFTDAGELVYTTGAHTSNNTIGLNFSGTIKVPIYALTGPTRMRVVYAEQIPTPSSCGAYTSGETEDYTIVINDPVAGTYTWTGAVSNDYSQPNNWSPARLIPNIADRLVFNHSTSIQQLNSEQVKSVFFADGINIAFFASQSVVLNAFDTLMIGNNTSIQLQNTIQLKLGADTNYTGYLICKNNGGIAGQFNRWMNATNDSLLFPLIDSMGLNKHLILTFNQLPTNYGNVSFEFIQQNPGDLGLPLFDQSASKWAHLIGINGYWEMSQQGFPSLLDFNIQLAANGFYGIQNAAELLILYRQNNNTNWQSIGVHVPTTGSNSMPVLRRASLTQVGQFGIASDANYNSLPVRFLDIDAWKSLDDVLVSWKTAMEINNLGFEVQRSTDNFQFDSIGFVKGFNYSMTIKSYSFKDAKAFTYTAANNLYYRIKQIDIDGKTSYSATKQVFSHSIPFSAGPVPFTDKLTLSFSMPIAGKASICLYNLSGQMVLEMNPELQSGNQQFVLQNLDVLPTGIYVLKFNTDFENCTLKVLK